MPEMQIPKKKPPAKGERRGLNALTLLRHPLREVKRETV
jgi:hypothetical protein